MNENTKMTPAERENIKTKTMLLVSMAGKDPENALTALSYALMHTTLRAGITFSSVVRNLAEMYENAIERHSGDEDGEGG